MQPVVETVVAPGNRARWPYVLAGVLLVTLAAPEALYRFELAKVPERPALPVSALPPLVLHAASLELLQSPSPETGGIYPWTVLVSAGRLLLHRGAPRVDVNALTARTLLLSGRRRGHVQWVLANFALAIWVSRHLTGSEALSSAVQTRSFGRGAHGVEEAATKFIGKPLDQMDPEQVARVLVLAVEPTVSRDRDKWRLRRDRLLQELRQHGFIDEAVLREGMARAFEPDAEPASTGY